MEAGGGHRQCTGGVWWGRTCALLIYVPTAKTWPAVEPSTGGWSGEARLVVTSTLAPLPAVQVKDRGGGPCSPHFLPPFACWAKVLPDRGDVAGSAAAWWKQQRQLGYGNGVELWPRKQLVEGGEDGAALPRFITFHTVRGAFGVGVPAAVAKSLSAPLRFDLLYWVLPIGLWRSSGGRAAGQSPKAYNGQPTSSPHPP